MGLVNRDEVILAGIAFAKACYDFEDEFDKELELNDCKLRIEDKEIDFEWLRDANDVTDALAFADEAMCSVQVFTREEFMDGVILCEGKLWETLYYYQGGQFAWFSKEITKELDDRLRKVLYEHGFGMDLSDPGRILLMSEASTKAQIKRDLGIDLDKG